MVERMTKPQFTEGGRKVINGVIELVARNKGNERRGEVVYIHVEPFEAQVGERGGQAAHRLVVVLQDGEVGEVWRKGVEGHGVTAGVELGEGGGWE